MRAGLVSTASMQQPRADVIFSSPTIDELVVRVARDGVGARMLGLLFGIVAVAVGAASLLGSLSVGVHTGFARDACENVRAAFAERIVGQAFATVQVRACGTVRSGASGAARCRR